MIAGGLAITTSFQEMKTITSFEGLYKLYYFLNSCAAITAILNVKWDNKLLNRLRASSKNNVETTSTASSETFCEEAKKVNQMEEKATNISFVSPVTPAGKYSMENEVEPHMLLEEGLAIPDVEAQVTNADWYLMEVAEM